MTTVQDSTTKASGEDVIVLNVGGHSFNTTKDTLLSCRGSFMEAMFSGRHKCPAQQKEDGSFFIDRDGTYFEHILNYLETKTVTSSLDETSKEALLVEAEYYGLPGLVRAIRMPHVDTNTYLSEETLEIWKMEEAMLKAFLDGTAADAAQHQGLVSLFGNEDYGGVMLHKLAYEPHKEDLINVLMASLRDEASPGVPVVEKVIIAGGSVLQALTTSPGIRTAKWWGEYKSDVDIFLYCDNPEEASRVAKRIFYALAVFDEHWIIMRSHGVITMQKWVHYDVPPMVQKVQIVLRLYDAPVEVLLGFDCDCCCCAYDGKSMWVTPRFLHAIQTGINILNPLHALPDEPTNYELRLAKYAYRGFPVSVPGLNKESIDHEHIQNTEISKLTNLARLWKVATEMEAPPLSEDVNDEGLEDLLAEPGDVSGNGFPQVPQEIEPLHPEVKRCFEVIGGYEDGLGNVIVPPSLYVQDVPFRQLWACPSYVPKEGECRDSAWGEIENFMGETVPEGVPSLLIDSWIMDKTSKREYINLSVDKYKLDNTYYGDAYKQDA